MSSDIHLVKGWWWWHDSWPGGCRCYFLWHSHQCTISFHKCCCLCLIWLPFKMPKLMNLSWSLMGKMVSLKKPTDFCWLNNLWLLIHTCWMASIVILSLMLSQWTKWYSAVASSSLINRMSMDSFGRGWRDYFCSVANHTASGRRSEPIRQSFFTELLHFSFASKPKIIEEQAFSLWHLRAHVRFCLFLSIPASTRNCRGVSK